MKLKDVKSRIPAYLDAGIACTLISAPGRGKSEAVHQLINELSERDGFQWGLVEMFLATQNPTDMSGLLFKGTLESNGQTYTIADPTLPRWMITTEGKPLWEYKRGIIFLDEYGQAEGDTKRVSAELMLNRRIAPWQAPDGWGVVAATNRANDRSGVTKDFDFVINRRGELHISDDPEGWTEYANQKGVHPDIVAFAETNKSVVFQDGVPDKQRPWCTPRSLLMMERIARQLSPDGGKTLPVDEQAIEIYSGIIGEPETVQFLTTMRMKGELPSYAEIVADPENAHLPSKPDARMLACYILAGDLKPTDFGAAITYVSRMPKEFALTFIKAAVKRDMKLALSKDFDKWAKNNTNLINAALKM